MRFKFKNEILPLLAIMATIVFSFYFYAQAPQQVPTHWNFRGEVDDYSSKAFAAYFFPALILGLYLLFWFLPKIDPRREKYESFAGVYGLFRTVMVLFMAGLYFLTGLAALGYAINIGKIVPAGVGLLLVLIGNYLGKIKSNWFVGIKTPWTLSSETVWQKTHRLGGWLFVLFGLLLFVSAFFPGFWNPWIFVAAIAILVIVPTIYSYWLFRKERNQ